MVAKSLFNLQPGTSGLKAFIRPLMIDHCTWFLLFVPCQKEARSSTSKRDNLPAIWMLFPNGNQSGARVQKIKTICVTKWFLIY